MIMSEKLHRTMAAMIAAGCCLVILAVQNRVPSLSKVRLLIMSGQVPQG